MVGEKWGKVGEKSRNVGEDMHFLGEAHMGRNGVHMSPLSWGGMGAGWVKSG